MVRRYVKTSKRQSWSEEDMQKAVDFVIKGGKYLKASKLFQVPRETLRRKVKLISQSNDPDHFKYKTNLGFHSVFTEEEEKQLEEQILDYEARMTGFTTIEIRALAYDFAMQLNKPNNFDHETRLAGVEWFRGFMKRHPNLALRKPEPTSAARATGFNKTVVNHYFDVLEGLFQEYGFTPDRIWNMDETGNTCNPKSTLRIISIKGKRQVGTKTSADRGENVTAVICMSARGDFMPPLLIFPRVKENKEYLLGAPTNAWAEFNRSGWMEDQIFTKWLKKFIEFSGSSRENPVLLLLDGHASHVRNVEAILLARDNGVVMLCFPPHCTHKMQPLDVGYMKPLSNCYTKELNSFTRNGRIVRLKDIYSIFGKAFIKASKMETAVNAFEKTGISPFNRNVFKDEDFVITDPPASSHTATDPLDIPANASGENVLLDNVSKETQESGFKSNPESRQGDSVVEIGSNQDVDVTIDDSSSQSESLEEIARKIKQEHAPSGSSEQTNSVSVTPDIIIDLVTKSVQEVLKSKLKSGDLVIASSNENKTPAKPKRTRAKGKPSVVTSDEYASQLTAQKVAKKPKKTCIAKSKKKVLSDSTNQQLAVLNPQSNQPLITTFMKIQDEHGQEILVPVISSNFQPNLQSDQVLDQEGVQYYYLT